MTWLEDFTPDQIAVVDELRKRTIKDASPKMLEDKYVFHRFCKARDFNLEKAEALIRKHIEWRKEFKADSLLDIEIPEVFLKYGTCYRCLTKDGRVMRYFNFGETDLRGLILSASVSDVLRMCMRLVEEDIVILRDQSTKLKRPLVQSLYVFDHKNLSLSTVMDRTIIEVTIKFLAVFQDNYPERIQTLFHINAPSYFSIGFSVLKAFMATPLLNKFRIFGTDGWKEELLKLVDSDQLPAILGGNSEFGMPYTVPFILIPDKVPQHYYVKKSRKTLARCPDAHKLAVRPLSKTELKVSAEKANQVLEWEIEIKSGDINLEIYFTDQNLQRSQSEKILAKNKVDTPLESYKGIYKCKKAGTYTFVFDNSHSWINTKEVYHKIKMREDIELEAHENT